MAKQIAVDEKSDGLEIVSVGKLYQGPLEKKYWSSSRGKDRYPYPVGYGAVRTFNGITYKMEILEGFKGPDFVISSSDGQVYSGQTPDGAWEGFQKKTCVRIKLWRGKRFSCKIDGVELFGLKNPSVRRLLQDLVASFSETSEQTKQSSCFGNRQFEETYQHHADATVYCTETCKVPDLQSDMDKSQVEGKRSRKSKDDHVKSTGEPKIRRARPRCLTQGDGPQASRSCKGNPRKGIPSTSSASHEYKAAALETLVEGGNVLNQSSSTEDELHLDSSNSSKHLEKEKCPSPLELDRSTITKMQGLAFSEPEEEEGEGALPKDSLMLNSGDPCAPNNVDLASDGIYNTEVEIPKDSTCTANDVFNGAQNFISGDPITESHVQDEIAAANENSEKGDLVGEEIARSMMTVLLPRALPLLKTSSELGTKSFSEQSQAEKQKGKVRVPDEHFNENFQVQKQENDQLPSTHMGSHVPSLGYSTSEEPDNLEQDLCEILEYICSTQFHDDTEAVENSFLKNSCMDDEHHVHNASQQMKEVCHVEVAASKACFPCRDVHRIMEKKPQGGCNITDDHCLGITLPGSKDVCIHSDSSTSIHQRNKKRKADNISACCTRGTVGTGNLKSTSADCIKQVARKRIGGVTGVAGAGGASIVSIPSIANSTSHYNAPHSKSIICGDKKGCVALETCFATKERPYEQQSPGLHSEKTPKMFNPTSCDKATGTSHQDYVWTSNYRDTSDVFSTSVTCGGRPQASCYNELLLDGSFSSSLDQKVSCHGMTEKKEAKDESLSNTKMKMMNTDEQENIFELVGFYVHPKPISMVLLRTEGSEINICVLCGYLMEKDRKLFIYKASIEGEKRGCPSLIGHATVISPISKDAFGREISLGSSGLQFTPDGKCLVLLDSIKAPYCRTGNVNCLCSVCTSDCLEKNAVKIVQVKLGYIQVMSRLKTTDKVCCILVCEPSHLVAAEESGGLHLWTMNSTWSAQTEESYLPKSDCMPNYIVEMKKIPNFTSLVVGHNAFGDFCLWDLSRQILLSKFSAPTASFFKFLPINLFRCPTKDQILGIMDESKTWSAVSHASLPVKEEELSVVLLVSRLDLQNSNPLNSYGVDPIGCWSLALLAKSKLICENALDPSASIVGASAGYGLIGTRDGFLYVWELSTGTKIGYLKHCQGAIISCFAVDDSNSGAFAVTGDGSQLQVYSYSPRKCANRKLD